MKKYVIFITVILVFALLAALSVSPKNRVAAQNWSKGTFSTLFAKSLGVTGLSTFSGGITGNSANTGALPIDASIAFTPYSSTETIESGGTIFPYRPVVAIIADGAVSTSASNAIADGWNDGQILTVINFGSNEITVKNNANTIMGSDIVLGQYDSITFWWDGYNWLRSASADN